METDIKTYFYNELEEVLTDESLEMIRDLALSGYKTDGRGVVLLDLGSFDEDLKRGAFLFPPEMYSAGTNLANYVYHPNIFKIEKLNSIHENIMDEIAFGMEAYDPEHQFVIIPVALYYMFGQQYLAIESIKLALNLD